MLDIPEYSWIIYTNSDFNQPIVLTDLDTTLAGDPDGWTAECEIRTARVGGVLVTRFNSSGTWDGQIRFDDSGNAWFTLPAAKAALLAPASNCPFDVLMVDPTGGKSVIATGFAYVIQGVTTDA